ncbi:hypothetical protein [Algiphilus sp.]|uniref:hypothetical protein n=1 Tax=Algiphilus sp. TaxID=1872431 RepID=UPI003B522359
MHLPSARVADCSSAPPSDPRHIWFFRLLARITEFTPTVVAVPVARWVLGVRGVAGMLTYLPTATIERLSLALPAYFVARVALALDAPRREWIADKLPIDALVASARELIALHAFAATAAFAALLPRLTLREVVVQLHDTTGVAHITGHLNVDKATEVLTAYTPALAAEILDEMVRQGYLDLTAAVGHRLPAPERQAIETHVTEETRHALDAEPEGSAMARQDVADV